MTRLCFKLVERFTEPKQRISFRGKEKTVLGAVLAQVPSLSFKLTSTYINIGAGILQQTTSIAASPIQTGKNDMLRIL
jgi:hypothetical protein